MMASDGYFYQFCGHLSAGHGTPSSEPMTTKPGSLTLAAHEEIRQVKDLYFDCVIALIYRESRDQGHRLNGRPKDCDNAICKSK